MIERKFISEKIKEFQIGEYIKNSLRNVGLSSTKLQRTPLGEKIVVCASRPGLIVGKGGQNIKQLTKTLKKKFNLENPQIAISEVEDQNLDVNIVAERIADTIERYGVSKFKGIVHKAMTNVMKAGAHGIEIIISGKIPSARAKSWRFFTGYMKKCGDVATTEVKSAYANAQLKSGTVGIKVSIMPPTAVLLDKVAIKDVKTENTQSQQSPIVEGKNEVEKQGDKQPQ